MKIKAGQKLIDKIRGKKKIKQQFMEDRKDIVLNLNFGTNETLTNEDIIKKIKDYGKTINCFSLKADKEFTGYNLNSSALDPLGGILEKDNKIYRGVYKKSKDYFIELYNTGILQVFSEIGFMPKFKLTNYFTEDFPIIFEIEKLCIIPPIFWSFSMIKEEALLKIRMMDILNEFGYTLIDGHCKNATFKNGKVIFFDFGSIIKGNYTGAYREIYTYNIVPLIMLNFGDYACARDVYVVDKELRLLPHVSYMESYEVKNVIKRFTNSKNRTIMKKIEKCKPINTREFEMLLDCMSYKKDTCWGDYNAGICDNLDNSRFGKIAKKIEKYSSDARSLLDLAGNSGYVAKYLTSKKNYDRVLTSDYDEMAIEKGICQFKNQDITFILLNSMLPYSDSIFNEIKSDIVCAFALTHHLILTQKFNIDFMFSQMKKYVNKYIYVEFCPLGMYSSDYPDYKPDVPDWYTEEFFEKHFKKYFKLVDKDVIDTKTINCKEYQHRILYIGTVIQ